MSHPGFVGPGKILARLLEEELRATPLEKWGFMFPGHVAVWRFIEDSMPGVLGPLRARFGDEPEFEGQGADWFVTEVVDRDDYLDILDGLMRSAVDQLRPEAVDRGFVMADEPIVLSILDVQALAAVVLAAARGASA